MKVTMPLVVFAALFASACSAPAVPMPVAETVEPIACKACTDAMAILDYLLDSPLGKGSIELLLKDLCVMMPTAYAKNCNDTVDGFMDLIVKFIVDMTKDVCPMFVCTTTVATTPTTPSTPTPQPPTTGAATTAAPAKTMVNRANGMPDVCAVLNAIYRELPTLMKRAEAFCDQLPDPALAKSCHDAFSTEGAQIEAYARKLIKLLADNIPFIHCTIIEPTTVAPPPTKTAAPAAVAAVKSSTGCVACDDTVSMVDHLLQSPIAKGSLESVLQGLCMELPAPYGANCKKSVNSFIDDIVKFIVDMTQKICPAIGCPENGLSDVCAVLQKLYDALPTLAKEAEAVCDVFPTAERQQCHEMFAQEEAKVLAMGQHVLQWIADHVPFVHCKIVATPAAAVSNSLCDWNDMRGFGGACRTECGEQDKIGTDMTCPSGQVCCAVPKRFLVR